ncbi:MAG: DoxX family membrane protein [Saprospiraceae bacterium]|nr:DoxX family membrane protein [Saprospiraceae bacterium]
MFSRKGFWNFVIVSIRIFLGYIFFSAGMAKLLDGQFPGIIGPVWLEERLAEYGLGLFARFIAFSQVIVGLLVLSQRFATVGAVMLFPIITTTLMVTISLEWRGTPYVLGFFLLLNAILLLADYHKLKFLLTDQPAVLKRFH